MSSIPSVLPLAISKMLDYPQLGANSTLLTQITPSQPHFPFYYVDSPQLVSWTSDKIIGVAAPTVVYWICSIMFYALDVVQLPYFEKRRIHESSEVIARNKVSVGQVIRMVIFQQIIQTGLGMWWLEDGHDTARDVMREMRALAPKVATGLFVLLGPTTGEQVLKNYGESIVRFMYWWAIPAAQLWLGFFIIDTWQYTLHRLMHTYHFLYRHLHSWHHRLYVPYAFGALYNHPIEGFVLDSVGTALAEMVVGMSVRQAALIFGLASAKTVDDHSGYKIWWDPCQLLFYNNADYHDIHHQAYGIKKNFSQPFFTNWDLWLGTHMSREEADNRVGAKTRKLESKAE